MSTPLQIAILSCHVAAITLLIKQGADTTVPFQIPRIRAKDDDDKEDDDEYNMRRAETIRLVLSYELKPSLLDEWTGVTSPINEDPCKSYVHMGLEALRAIKEVYTNITAEESISGMPRRRKDTRGIMDLFNLSDDEYVALFMPRTAYDGYISTFIYNIHELLQDGFTVIFTKEDLCILHDKHVSYGTYDQGLMVIKAIIRDDIVKIADDAKPAMQRLSDAIKCGNYIGHELDYNDEWSLFY
jgi:hypothetical protein